jgi:diacylglycerol O-acyltransferase / wax synthase
VSGVNEPSPAWGSETTMSPFESVMWRLEADPLLRVPTLTCEQLDTSPDWDRFVSAHEWAVRMAPRFRKKVVEPPLGMGASCWSEDVDFDLLFHLRRQRLPENGGWPELMEALAQFFMTPLDRSRPPWEAVLFQGLPEGGALYALKMHHSVSDGLGVMQLLSRLHSRTREHNPNKPEPAPSAGEPIDAAHAWLRQVRSDVDSAPRLAGQLGSEALRIAANPVRSVRSAVDFGLSAGRVINPPVGDGSPLLAGRSLAMRLATLDVPFGDFRAAAKAGGGSVNDAFLAALLGGYRRYHEAMGVPVVETVPTGFPISLRKADDPAGGNQIAAARVAGPVAEPDPVARIARIRELVRAARAEPAIDIMGIAAPLLARLPGQVVAKLAGPMTLSNDLMASNVPGLGEGFYLAGARVERFFGYGRSGAAALITFISHGDVGCVGLGFDPAAFTEPSVFVECIVEGFREVLALHPGAAEPRLYG